MQIALTKKLADILKTGKLPPLETESNTVGFYTWRANITQEGHYRLLVFMNEASRYILAVQKPKAKDFKRLPELFIETLRNTLLLEQVNPAIVDRYIAEAGKVTFVANSGRDGTARLNTACEYAWFGVHPDEEEVVDNDYLSVFANHISIVTVKCDTNWIPYKEFFKLLSRYGLPVKCSTAYDLSIRLNLADEDAVRQIRVPANITFTQLHKIIQNAFCWNNCHLYRFCFFKGVIDYSKPDVELVSMEDLFITGDLKNYKEPIMTHDVRLSEYLPKWKKCIYNYDYGDNWCHFIELTKIHENYEGDMPLLLLGSGDAPPEDVGAAPGFEEFKKIIANRNDDEYEEMISWAESQEWEPFDFEKTARKVKSALWWH